MLLRLLSSLFSGSSLFDNLSGLSLQRVNSSLELSSDSVSLKTGGVTNESPCSSRVDSLFNSFLYNFLNSRSLGLLATASYKHSSCNEHKCNLFHFFCFFKSVKQSFVN